MKDKPKDKNKLYYSILAAVAIILVYKFLDNFTAIGEAIGKFFER